MATGARGLLDRLNMLMGVNVAVLDDRLIEDVDILRLVDTRHVLEAIELARVLHSYLGGSNLARDGGDRRTVLPASVTSSIGSSGRSCWVRHMLSAAAFANCRQAEDELTTSLRHLCKILHGMKRTVANYHRNIRYRNDKQGELIRHIRKLPEAYRTFYALVDVKLAMSRPRV
jgi:hypothetical protein